MQAPAQYAKRRDPSPVTVVHAVVHDIEDHPVGTSAGALAQSVVGLYRPPSLKVDSGHDTSLRFDDLTWSHGMDARIATTALLALTLSTACDPGSNRWAWQNDWSGATEAEAAEAAGSTEVAKAAVAAAPVETTEPATREDLAAPATSKSITPAANAAPGADGELVPFALPAGATVSAPAECAIPGLSLPAEFKVYAAGAYAGRKLDYQIDQSGHPATRIDVAVNEAAAPVVLMLGAYEPTVWNIGWSPDTKIAAVLVSGYHRQVLAGLPASVPRLISSHDNKGPCAYFYLSKDRLEQVNPIARRLFGKAVDHAYLARDGFVTVGSSLATGYVTDSRQSPEQFRDPGAPLAGEAGLRDAVAKGLLREARSSDLAA